MFRIVFVKLITYMVIVIVFAMEKIRLIVLLNFGLRFREIM